MIANADHGPSELVEVAVPRRILALTALVVPAIDLDNEADLGPRPHGEGRQLLTIARIRRNPIVTTRQDEGSPGSRKRREGVEALAGLEEGSEGQELVSLLCEE